MESIVTEYPGISIFTGRPAECQHHLIFGSLRHLADEDGLVIPLTHFEHNMAQNNTDMIHGNITAERLSKLLGQAVWECQFLADRLPDGARQEAREAFRKRYGISFM